MTDRIGQQLGSYRLLQLLGKGGFAEVYLGEHIYLRTPVAIKLLHASLNSDEIEAFLSEAQTVARLAHPHIVRVLDFAIQEGTTYLVMEYAPGGTLRAQYPKGAQLALATIAGYVRQVADALYHAHTQRLIHRDVKPENMLLNAHSDVLLSDFGIATLSHSSRSQSTADVVGTAAYMAPEQFLGKPRPASDQYALGIVVYEWLTGSRPFQGSFLEISGQHLHVPPPSMRAQRPDLPPEVEAVVLRALAKDPHDRFPDLLAFADALGQSIASSQPMPPAPAFGQASSGTRSAPDASLRTRSAPIFTAEAPAVSQISASLDTPVITRVSAPLVSVSAEAPVVSPTIKPTWQSGPPPIHSAPKPPLRQRNRRPLLAIVGALLLLLIPLGVLYGYWLPAQRAQQSLEATRAAGSQQATQTGAAQAAGTSSAQINATSTAEQATANAQNATATAQHTPPTLPYHVLVPGPCGPTNTGWTWIISGDQLDCQPDHLTLKGNAQGTSSISFTLYPFPQSYLVTLDVSHIVGSSNTGITLEINGVQQGYFFAISLRANNTLFPETGNGISGGGPQFSRSAAGTNTLGIRVRGTTGGFLYNATVVYSTNLPQAIATSNITITLEGSAGDQVDLQNFTLTQI
jgi:serine/threonine protein kinase